MREVFAKLGEDIRLGRRGENLATRVTFDVSGWMSSGEGTIHLLHQRNGDNVPYPCAITVDGGTVTWEITAADVEIAGRGRAELQYLDGDVCKKSAIYTTNTLRALNKAGKVPPEPHEGWVREVLEAKVAAESAASDAQGSAQTAEGWAHDAGSSAQEARGEASRAQNAASQAQSAAGQAANQAANQAVSNVYGQLQGLVSDTQSAAGQAQSAAEVASTAANDALKAEERAAAEADRAEVAAYRAESAGAQPDWDQNDSEAKDYVKNRPFYRTSTPVYEEYPFLPDRMITFDGQVATFTYPVDIPTKRCTVFWGDSQYECDPVVADGGFYLIQLDVFTIEYSAGGTFKVTAINRYDRLILKITSLRVAGYEVVKLPNEYLDADYIKEVSRDDAHIKEVVNEDYIKGVVNEDYIKEAVGEAEYIAPDWDQNNYSAAGYIKNRPFYDGAVTIFPEATWTYEDDGIYSHFVSGEFNIKPGETYTVKWNGADYECVAEGDDDLISLACENVFAIENYPNGDYYNLPYIEFFAYTPITVTVSISQCELVKLPDKYLDMTAEEWTFELEDGTTVTKQVMVK